VILAFHVIFSFYRFWLPNDPRGSWSDWIRSWELLRYGGATKTDARHSVARTPHDYRKRTNAKKALKYPPVILDGLQARAVARGFARACAESGYVIHACAIMPNHVHLVVARCDRMIEKIVGHLKAFATHQLNEEGLHPLATHAKDGVITTPWAHGTGWTVYLDGRADIVRSISYVNGNPEREGLPQQNWKFVIPYV
jgi:REP element-mobilizing transposase RayT